MRYQAVCFDIDGTLYDPKLMRRNLTFCWLLHPVLMSRYSRMRRDFRLIQKGREFPEELDMAERESLILLHREADFDLGQTPTSILKEDPFLKRMKADLLNKIYRPMARAMHHLKPREGVAETFIQLRKKGIKVGVLSDFPIEGKLKTLGLSTLVDFQLDCNDAGYLKPDKRCFDKLMECGNMTGVSKQNLLYVGDSYKKDYIGAEDAGWDAALIGQRSESSKAFLTWSDFNKWLFATLEV